MNWCHIRISRRISKSGWMANTHDAELTNLGRSLTNMRQKELKWVEDINEQEAELTKAYLGEIHKQT